MKFLMAAFLLISTLMITETTFANEVKLNDPAPLFKVKNQAGVEFDLASRKGKWTVLYFYPKAGTPGCTKQACAFRDSVKKIRDLGAEVYGISTDTISDQAKFHKEHHLGFDLLADSDAKVTELYGAKMPVVKVSKRWTFIIDPQLKIKNVLKDVDPAMDSDRVVAEIKKLQK
ncbi:peroxiredoxin [Pseudobdellovibrio sp. HCB154]|uniref:peroxiredoxin n=1 Tax=Pseudobdellovibrio sp. HCB154 TaxID=3386277 RepID=UPI0039171C86